ncbi:DNA methyltransferase, partial [Vibrio diabolicus]|uniref:DNA methyltransferase n=1 Tax=Vibrio diabolicus TaxID=50719 RepID=UPI00237BC7D0
MSQTYQMDAVDWLRTLDDSSVDLFITDPPYESLEKHRKIPPPPPPKESKSSSNQWFSIFPNTRFEELFTEIYRVLKKGSHFYLFCDQETMFVAKPIAEQVGFKFWKPIVWDKCAIGMGYHYRARYEFIL